MFILHIALQGCLRARDVEYGLTPDTGGHIKYLLELVEAVDRERAVDQQEIVVRRFEDAALGAVYGAREERVSAKSRIVRLDGAHARYLAKEELFTEAEALAGSLERYIAALDRRPDIIHAHYADAGWLAAEMKERLGIPFVFTAHSLGRVKEVVGRRSSGMKSPSAGDGQCDDALSRRIGMEERAISAADRIVASSFDEAELQYASYHADAAHRIRVNPPGCDLGAFADAPPLCPEFRGRIERSWSDPRKPVVLAVARPVRRKNLEGLLDAYGRDRELRDRANLLLVAGVRGEIEDQPEEQRDVLHGLSRLIERHGLEGRVAMPERHAPADIPSLYRYAARSGGVFANVAYNEPFGLTLLEAAASGLPVVATDSGGPNDILERCGNGRLVNPRDRHAIAAALRELVTDDGERDRAARAGREACEFYRWGRHARAYVQDLAHLVEPETNASPAAPRVMIPTLRVPAVPGAARRRARVQGRGGRLLVCDIDNTLTGDAEALGELAAWLADASDCRFAIATGRSLQGALDIMERWSIPEPSILITSVGSEIYEARGSLHRLEPDTRYAARGDGAWDRERTRTCMSALDWLEPQAGREQRRRKLSYFLRDPSRLGEARAALRQAGIAAEVIHSHGEFLDILPPRISKGHAIEHVAERLGVPMDEVHAAGDSGNDLHMLRMVGRPIVVGNHSDELAGLRDCPRTYFARRPYAAGVLEGLMRFEGARTLRRKVQAPRTTTPTSTPVSAMVANGAPEIRYRLR